MCPHLNSTPAMARIQNRGRTRVATNTHTSGTGALGGREGGGGGGGKGPVCTVLHTYTPIQNNHCLLIKRL